MKTRLWVRNQKAVVFVHMCQDIWSYSEGERTSSFPCNCIVCNFNWSKSRMSEQEKNKQKKWTQFYIWHHSISSKYRIHLKRIFQSPLFIIRSSSGNADLLFDLFKQNTVFFLCWEINYKDCLSGRHTAKNY